MPAFNIYLVRSDTIRPRPVLFETIRDALGALCDEGGKELVLVPLVQEGEHLDGPQIVFDWQVHHVRSGEQFITHRSPMLAGESGVVFVNVLLELRTGGPPVYPTHRGGRVDFATPTAPVFTNGEADFARAVGNVTVHEIGHTLGIQSHSNEPSNFMVSGFDRAVPRPGARRENLRAFWSGRKSFNEAQRQTLLGAIRTGQFGGEPVLEEP